MSKNMVDNLWEIVEQLRGDARTEDYKNYIFPLLTLKYLSDSSVLPLATLSKVEESI